MQQILINKLHHYLVQHHLDILISLQEDHKVTRYLKEKVDSVKELVEQLEAENRPIFVIEALCLEELTKDLRPSRFTYMLALMEEEFVEEYAKMRECGTLTYEMVNLIGACQPVFEVYGFSEENQASPELRFAIKGMMQEYITNKL